MISAENVNIEQEVLGAILNNNALLEECKTFINYEMFAINDHKEIYKELYRLIEEGKTVDITNFIQYLGAKTAKLGGVNYLYEISECCPSQANFKAKLDIVIANYQNKLMQEASRKVLSESDVERNKETLEKVVNSINSCCNVQEIDPVEEGNRYLIELEKRMNGETMKGIPTGFTALDKKIKNLRPGKVITVQARSSVGKTAFALQLSQNVALKSKGKVFYSTGEMDEIEVRDRMVASKCSIEYDRVMSGTITPQESVNIVGITDILSRNNLHVSEETDFRKAVNELKLYIQKFGKADVWVLDYLDLFADGVPGDNETQRLGYISRNVKKIARQYKLTAIILAQTKRDVDRENKHSEIYEKVKSGDLQGSAKIEQDSDIMLALYRNLDLDNDMARKNMDIDYNSKLADKNPEVMNVTITKGRDCKKGTIALRWKGQYQRVEDF